MRASLQIEYANSEGENVESFTALDPRNVDERKLMHKFLDEYIDRCVIPVLNGERNKIDLKQHLTFFDPWE